MLNYLTLFLTFSCIKEKCVDNNVCYGEFGQAEYRGCVIRRCREAASQCLTQTVHDVTTKAKKENPSASIESVWTQAAKTIDADVPEIANCLNLIQEDPIDALINVSGCVLDALFQPTQEDGNNRKPHMSNDQAYTVCWIKKVTKGLFGCVSPYDLPTLNTLLKYLQPFQEVSKCTLKKFPLYSEHCMPALTQIFGNSTSSQFSWEESADCFAAWGYVYKICLQEIFDLHGSEHYSPSITVYAKDIFICNIHQMISATAAC